ncbi:MAG: hypothetical protein ACXVCH_17480 [Bdellovibrionota bacterium]
MKKSLLVLSLAVLASSAQASTGFPFSSVKFCKPAAGSPPTAPQMIEIYIAEAAPGTPPAVNDGDVIGPTAAMATFQYPSMMGEVVMYPATITAVVGRTFSLTINDGAEKGATLDGPAHPKTLAETTTLRDDGRILSYNCYDSRRQLSQ